MNMERLGTRQPTVYSALADFVSDYIHIHGQKFRLLVANDLKGDSKVCPFYVNRTTSPPLKKI